MLTQFVLKIKRRENSFYSTIYRMAKTLSSVSFPCIKPIHLLLYYCHKLLRRIILRTIHMFWSVPLFSARCDVVGKNLFLPNGIPLIIGSHLKIFLGDNVTISKSTIGASKLFDEPVLKIGNNSKIGYGTVISVSKEVVIGDNCLISPHCMIMDSDDHPINPQKRILQQGVDKEKVLPVKIGNNVWIGSYCTILKGVTIHDNSVISTHSVVTRDVMPNCVYSGFPARPTLRDIDKL